MTSGRRAGPPSAGPADHGEGVGPAGPPHLVLVGLPGAGKSTVGALLAAPLRCAFLDFDVEIEKRLRLSSAGSIA